MRFVKMHGIGNDYIYLDAVGAPELAERKDLPDLARRMSDRHRGVGSDGLILVCRPTDAAVKGAPPGLVPRVRMRMFNADGSESEMCGNGVRCVAKFAHDRLGITGNPMPVETGRGILSIAYETRAGKLVSATVDMGAPIVEARRVPVRETELVTDAKGRPLIRAGDQSWPAAFVSMGNPHVVFFESAGKDLTTETLRALDLPRIGPVIEHNPAFPNRVNSHFVAVRGPREAMMRTWERGAGATQACGTGACAVLVAGVLTGRLQREALLHLPGGDLNIRWDERSNHVFMTGPAEDVFEGEWPEDRTQD